MEKEISSAAMLGVVLMALAMIILITFTIFSIGKKSANEGATSLQEKIELAESSEYMSYDQTIVSGSTVKQALSEYEGRNMAILVATQSFTDIEDRVYSITSSPASINAEKRFTAVYSSKTAKVDDSIYLNVDKGYENNGALAKALVFAGGCEGYEPGSGTSNCYLMNTSGGFSVIGGFINYNALLADGGNKEGSYGDSRVANVAFDGGCIRCSEGFEMENDLVQFNNSRSNVNKSGTFEYVSDSARFNSYLVKDTTGTVVGVAFIQIKTN